MRYTKGANRQFKDRLFKFLFGNPEHKDWTLSLCNALLGTNYTDAESIELTTIEDAVYMKMKNDVSLLLHGEMLFLEQQSTRNPNMPSRFFEYSGMAYGALMEQSPTFDLFSTKLQKLPTPYFFCLYNGTDKEKDRYVLKLSDAFMGDSGGRLELLVDVININYGRNKELLDACSPLKEYSFFVERTRFHLKSTNSLEVALDIALNDLPDDAVIKPFLLANRAEVKAMCITEYDEEKTLRGRYEEGIEKGIEKGRIKTLAELVKDGILTIVQAAARAQMTEEEFIEKAGLRA